MVVLVLAVSVLAVLCMPLGSLTSAVGPSRAAGTMYMSRTAPVKLQSAVASSPRTVCDWDCKVSCLSVRARPTTQLCTVQGMFNRP